METIKPEFYIPDDDYFIGIQSMSVTYVQKADDKQRMTALEYNELTVTAESSAGADENSEPYYYAISTERWAVDEASDLSDVLEDSRKRLLLVSNPEIKKKL